MAQFREAVKIGFIYNLEPSCKGYFLVGMFFPELDQCFAGDDVHGGMVSQFEIFRKSTFQYRH